MTDALAAERELALREFGAGHRGPMEAYCRKALALKPDDSFAASYLAMILMGRNEHEAAISAAKAAVQGAPSNATHYLNLGHYLIQVKRYVEAFEVIEKATQLAPGNANAWINLSSAAYHLERFDQAIAAARRAVEIDPRSDRGLNNLATALKGIGRIGEAIETYERAIEFNPDNAPLHTNLMLSMMYDADTPVERIVEAARNYSRIFELPLDGKRKPLRNLPMPDRRLRIGFLSPDFSSHAVMYFAEPVLSRLSRQEFEIYCYHLSSSGDGITVRTRALADRFRVVSQMGPEAMADLIREDAVDILIDLAGHTAGNGLQTMLHKPAPVQVTWLGYPGTTGLKCIDWRITDNLADPQGAETQYSEGLIRLPGTFCVYRPHIRNAAHRYEKLYQVAPAPSLSNGYITFGSCNNIAKLSPLCIETWCRILQAVPNSRLLIEGKALNTPASTQDLRVRFAAHGIAEDRLIFVARDARLQYLTYHRVDLALDSFPLTGGTTTFDTLWMGVRVVTLMGSSFRERLSASILSAGGFQEDVCSSIEQYVARAIQLASDPTSLAQGRAAVRQRMRASALMNEARFVGLFAKSLREVWKRWCGAQTTAAMDAVGEDLTPVLWQGARYTLPAAVRLMRQMRSSPDRDTRHRSPKLAQAILECVPDNPAAQELMATVKIVTQTQTEGVK